MTNRFSSFFQDNVFVFCFFCFFFVLFFYLCVEPIKKIIIIQVKVIFLSLDSLIFTTTRLQLYTEVVNVKPDCRNETLFYT